MLSTSRRPLFGRGGFGSVDDANYLQDTIDTFSEFGRFATRAIGGLGVGLSILLAGSSLWLLSRIRSSTTARPAHIRTTVVAAIAFSVSILVSYKFFQQTLYWPVRVLAFASSDAASGSTVGFWGMLPDGLRHLVSRGFWELSEFLHRPPLFEAYAWFSLALPTLAGTSIAVLVFGLSPWRSTNIPTVLKQTAASGKD